MTDEMSLADYLEQGGRLTTPANVPTRYRAELMKTMATFVDSELAAAAGFADMINSGPGTKERIAAARIVLEKTDNADQVLQLMGEFGADTERYATHYPWAERLSRDASPDTPRHDGDMRLPVLNFPFSGWDDAVVMNLLMGLAVGIQLTEYKSSSYQPFADAIRAIIPCERRHTELALEGVEKLIAQNRRKMIEDSVAYWWPRVFVSFGPAESPRAEAMKKMGLRQRSNADLRAEWVETATDVLKALGLSVPKAA